MMMLEKYTIVEPIGDSHKVYLVKNIQDNSFYVKKILDIYDKSVYEWLSHHHISGIPIIKEIYEENHHLIIIEEYISGRTLETILETKNTWNEKEVRQIIIKICSILKEITDKLPLVHRDIKPSNIIIKDDGELYLIDFNTAKINKENKSRDTMLLGTQGYAAPEQYGFASSNIQTDIYAIGVLTKELITGNIDLNENYTSKLKPIIQKCTMMDPKKRYNDYDTLLTQLKQKGFSSFKDYLPIGFQSGNPLSICLSIAWYSMIFFLSKGLTVEGITGTKLIMDQVGFGLSLVAITFFSGNYLNCHQRIKLHKIKHKSIKLIVIVVVDFVIFFSMLFLTSFIDVFF